MSKGRVSVVLFALVAVICALLAVPAFADSQVRIVRLSDLNGDVLIDRAAGQGFERALLNMPIVQGTKLWTKSDDARAEVEFENGSTVRLAPGSQVSFPQLALRDSGVKASTVTVTGGTVYFNFTKDKESDFQVQFGGEQVSVPKSASFRIEMSKGQFKLAVLKGDLEVQGASGTLKLSKNKTATFDAAANTSTVAKGIAREPFDDWNKAESKYQQEYARAGAPYHTPFAYGLSDLNYYGNYAYIAPYGWMWQPFGVGAGWNPYMNGAWCYYPGFGYSWVSTYPWGWLPYRYGSWAFIPGWGWGWQPSPYWAGWLASPVIINPPAGFVAPRVPMGGTRTVLVRPPHAHPGPAPNSMFMNRLANGRVNPPVPRNLRPLTSSPAGKNLPAQVHGVPAQVPGAAIIPRRGGMPSTVHGATMNHGAVAPRPSAGSFGGEFSHPTSGLGRSGGIRSGGGFSTPRGGGFSRPSAPSISSGHVSSGASHGSPK